MSDFIRKIAVISSMERGEEPHLTERKGRNYSEAPNCIVFERAENVWEPKPF